MKIDTNFQNLEEEIDMEEEKGEVVRNDDEDVDHLLGSPMKKKKKRVVKSLGSLHEITG